MGQIQVSKPVDLDGGIPLVDLGRARGSEAERAALVAEVTWICHHIGFMQVVNHGIEPGFMDRLFDLMSRLFDLSESDKALIDKTRSRHFRGWEREGTEYTNNRKDIREQVDIWSETRARAVDAQPPYMRLLGPNQWLPDDVLPGYREIVEGWFRHAGGLARELLGILSLGLGLPEQYINDLFGEEQMSLIKLIRYPPTPAGEAGVNAHHDTGFLTVLAPGPVPGLEVELPNGDWQPLPYVKDALVINLGEMLQGMTGNYFVATPHRVITDSLRYAAGYFHGPSLATELRPLPLDEYYSSAVAASPRHAGAGYMALKHETEAGIGDMRSSHRPAVYGEQLWNYFVRSYPGIVRLHYPDCVD